MGYRVICYKTSRIKGAAVEADGMAESLRQAVDSAEIIVGGIPIEKKGLSISGSYPDISGNITRCLEE